jgi:hypothetical protein
MVCVQSEMNPMQWREQLNTQIDASTSEPHLYLILSGTSEGDILRNFYDQGGTDAQPLWLNTPYCEWQEVMPYLVEVSREHAFLTWLEQHQADYPDWGVALLSDFPMEEVFSHFENLTKISLSSGKEVFFRFWDAPQSQPVLALSDEQNRAELMGPVSYWLSSQGGIDHPGEPQVIGKRFPWWVLSEGVEQALFSISTETLETNLLQQLYENNPALYEMTSLSVLKIKIRRLIKLNQTQAIVTRYSELKEYLQKELEDARRY